MVKHTILIVDDDSLILNTLKRKFDSWQMEVRSAVTPEEAKQVLEKITPDIVLLDLLLTHDDGSTSIRDYMKSQPRLAHVPIIVLTNLDNPELEQMLLKEGIKEYIQKGEISMDDLYNKVLGYLEPQVK